MAEESIVLDLEQSLKDDRKAVVKNQICARLNAEIDKVKQKIDGGVSQEEFQKCDILRKGYVTARDVVNYFWEVNNA